jgi:hypothetical protein
LVHAIEGSATLARPAPPSARQPPPQPANPASLPALLAVPEPAQPARLGVAIKQPPPVRLSTALGFRRISVAVRHSILPAADGRRRPPAWRLDTPGGRHPTGDRRGRLGCRRADAQRRSTFSSICRQESSYPDITARQVTGPSRAGRIPPQVGWGVERAGTTHTAAARRGTASCRADLGTVASGGHRAAVGSRGPVTAIPPPGRGPLVGRDPPERFRGQIAGPQKSASVAISPYPHID